MILLMTWKTISGLNWKKNGQRKLRKTLKQAQARSVKDVKLVRTIIKEDITGVDPNLINYNKDHIYQVTMDNDAQSTFYVNSELLMDLTNAKIGSKFF